MLLTLFDSMGKSPETRDNTTGSAQTHTEEGLFATSLASLAVSLNKVDQGSIFSLDQLAQDMRTPGAPLLPSYLFLALNEDFPDQVTAAQQQVNTHITEAVTELFSNLSDASEHARFLAALLQQEDPHQAVSYLFQAQRDADFKIVDLKIDGQHTPFNLYNYRPAPFLILQQQAQRYPSLNQLIENIQSHFQSHGIRVGAATSAGDPHQAQYSNPLSNSWGIFEDAYGYQMIGFFDDNGLLQGPGMVCHAAQGTLLTGERFEAGLLEGLGVFVGVIFAFMANMLVAEATA